MHSPVATATVYAIGANHHRFICKSCPILAFSNTLSKISETSDMDFVPGVEFGYKGNPTMLSLTHLHIVTIARETRLITLKLSIKVQSAFSLQYSGNYSHTKSSSMWSAISEPYYYSHLDRPLLKLSLRIYQSMRTKATSDWKKPYIVA